MRGRAVLLAAASSVMAACAEHGPSLEDELLDEVGAYDVVRFPPPPMGGVIVPQAVSDENVVVGWIVANQRHYPFRYSAGSYQVLGDGGFDAARAVAINDAGDVIGRTDVAVVWPAGLTEPVALSAVNGTLTTPAPLGINKAGAIAGGASGTGFYLAPVTRTLVYTQPNFTFRSISDSGDVAAYCGNRGVCVFGPTSSPTPTFFATLENSIGAFFMNSAGEFVVQGIPGHGNMSYLSQLHLRDGTALEIARPSPSGEWLAINASRWVVGTFDQTPMLGIVGKPGGVSLDAVLDRSGAESAAWHVLDARIISDRRTILALAVRPGLLSEYVLLVRRQ